MYVSSGFTYIWHSLHEEIKSTAAVWSAIGVARNNRGDGFERNTEFFCRNLSVGGENRTCTEIRFTDANQDRIVGVDFDPGFWQSGVEGVRTNGAGVGLRRLGPEKAQADQQRPASFDKATTRKRCPKHIFRTAFYF